MTTTTAVEQLREQARKAKAASRTLAKLSTAVKDRALLGMAAALESHADEIAAANQRDLDEAKKAGLSQAVVGRLVLDKKGIAGLAASVRKIADLPDPVGESFDARTLPNGLRLARRRVPMGVIGCIYESRPEVTIDIPSLCLKSGNAVILRGGKEAIHTNTALARRVRNAIAEAGVSAEAVQFIESTDRALVGEMLKMKDSIDLVVPRGGATFIQYVAENAAMPVITGGIGVVHIYVDRSADAEMAKVIIYNAKTQKPAVCNAVDGILVHAGAAERALPPIARELAKGGVELRCDGRALEVLKRAGLPNVKPASPEDWGTEFLALVAAVKVVDSLDEALAHIERYGSGHTEAIITEDYRSAQRFMDEVDAAVVLVNASTRFNDGGQFGLGAEVGISTQKMHARGPMGLREMTSYKWTVFGDGQVRP